MLEINYKKGRNIIVFKLKRRLFKRNNNKIKKNYIDI
jgi:hypothetical protein